ncbi:protein of unknown function DUF221-domain containing protein [Nitzschia inconspicua]|uniref:CSC1/OSCA1-like 7TM region domain-containing protein n=1 Tax=Nitzschia inconspicua TaxID=303405 RepID=A0A9K3Q7J8_9STRA|nr:protein of unknown function DUF221-domain containing protein [Nitzschia inconspicua]
MILSFPTRRCKRSTESNKGFEIELQPLLTEINGKWRKMPQMKCDLCQMQKVDANNHRAFAALCLALEINSKHYLTQSLADGGAINTWKQIDDIPVAPLADAPPRNIFFFRGCCRPVTITINYKEKKILRYSVILFLFFFCCLYTIPLATIQNLANPDFLATAFPDAPGLHDTSSATYKLFASISGPFSSLMLTLFFCFMPQLFKFLAFYDGISSSMEKAERGALLLYWYFMLVTAFPGASLANMFLSWRSAEASAEDSIQQVLSSIAVAIPGQIAPTWMNWIIMRYSFTWTGAYLFQMNSFITRVLNMKWLNRVMRGGGPGPPAPYRIFVDSGVVFMCIASLSPACPLIVPAAMIYFFVVQPILRWLLIFRPFSPFLHSTMVGGGKWPQLHQIIISALILGQILMAVTVSLMAAYWEGIFIGCCAIPTYLFHLWTLDQFYRPYHDCALIQTSRLGSWQDCNSVKKREEYRNWLVDSHKASYVPLCLLGTQKNLLTAETAVVVPKESDEETLDDISSRRQHIQRHSAQRRAMFNQKRPNHNSWHWVSYGLLAAVWMATRAHVLYARDCHVEDQDQDDQSDSDDRDCIGSRDGYMMASSSSPAAIELHQSKAQRSISYSSLEAIDNSSHTTFQSGLWSNIFHHHHTPRRRRQTTKMMRRSFQSNNSLQSTIHHFHHSHYHHHQYNDNRHYVGPNLKRHWYWPLVVDFVSDFFLPPLTLPSTTPFAWDRLHCPFPSVANVWFSMAFTVSSIIGTLRLMHVPPPETGMRVLSWREDYVPGKSSVNYWGFVAGVLCGIANLLQSQGGRMVGFATADLVQAFPLVSTLWDILLFGEYQQGGRRRQQRRSSSNNNSNINSCNEDGTYYESSTVVIFYLIGILMSRDLWSKFSVLSIQDIGTSSNKFGFQHLLALAENQNDSECDSIGPLEAALSPTLQCQNQHKLGYHSRKQNGGLYSQDCVYARAS